MNIRQRKHYGMVKSNFTSAAMGYSYSNISERMVSFPDMKYYGNISQNIDIFRNIIDKIRNIENETIRERVAIFINEFTNMISNVKGFSNILPPFAITSDEDSAFLEWVFKDFRIGFTFCENEEESMWFMVTNKNLEELSVSGDLKKSDYYSIIFKVIRFAVENT